MKYNVVLYNEIMNDQEIKEVLNGLTARRDELQAQMSDARHMRAKLRIDNIDKYREFIQKIGELSFVFGAALVPVIIVSGSDKVSNINFVLLGVGLYLLNGLISLWLSKTILERSVDSAPFVGLEEEVHTYPVINAHNKLLFDLKSEDFQEQYRKSSLGFIEWAQGAGEEKKKPKVSLWLDALITSFVFASLLVAKSVWTFGEIAYWITFVVIFLFMIMLMVTGYIKARQNQITLQAKNDELARVKKDYQDWHDKTILGKK